MNILLLSDLHNVSNMELLVRLSRCHDIDMILSLGDINEYQLLTVRDMCMNIPIVGVLGNYDNFDTLEKANVINVNLRTVTVNGIRITGIQGCHKHKHDNYPSYTQKESLDIVKNMEKSDILICHSPPSDVHDSKTRPSHKGLLGINMYIKEFEPKYCIHGHMHKVSKSLYYNTIVIGVYGLQVLNYETGIVTVI
mgnify:CR=1 FL=1